jgi:hypothetical protein
MSAAPALDTWELAIQARADEAERHRSIALAATAGHVHAIAEVIRARAAERGGNADRELDAMVETFRTEINGQLDRLTSGR